MKKYNIANYIRYKEDIKALKPKGDIWDYFDRKEVIHMHLPLVENIARKFSTHSQAIGVLTILDLIQESNSIFLSIDSKNENTGESYADSIEDPISDYNVEILNAYLLSLMSIYLNQKQYDVLKYSYGLACDKLPAKEIAKKIGLSGTSAYVRVSEIKKEAIQKLIDNVDHSQVVDYL
jgi:DNA-directed RNA polymerase specialized sigma subunit